MSGWVLAWDVHVLLYERLAVGEIRIHTHTHTRETAMCQRRQRLECDGHKP